MKKNEYEAYCMNCEKHYTINIKELKNKKQNLKDYKKMGFIPQTCNDCLIKF